MGFKKYCTICGDWYTEDVCPKCGGVKPEKPVRKTRKKNKQPKPRKPLSEPGNDKEYDEKLKQLIDKYNE